MEVILKITVIWDEMLDMLKMEGSSLLSLGDTLMLCWDQ
jgi:hypothetical protein